SKELAEIGVLNQALIVNGLIEGYDDAISESLHKKQAKAMAQMPEILKSLTAYRIPLRAYNITGMDNVRSLLTTDKVTMSTETVTADSIDGLKDVIEDLYKSDKKVIFTMGKGGVGKTTIAAARALGLAAKGKKVHLTTTDPAAHLDYIVKGHEGITMSRIDEAKELAKYRDELLGNARKNNLSEEDISYIEEDLRSPCTQEIAVFRAFAEIVDKADNEVVVIDTAPTGHTLLLLDSTQSYNNEIKRSSGDIPESAKKLLPRLRNKEETEVLIITLPEATPVYEAMRLEDDLKRAGIATKWWVVNSSMYRTGTTNTMLAAKASNEIEWINKIDERSKGNFALMAWSPDEIEGEKLKELIA
ncbi:MAG TPA: ArsA-related P-loop ATPase, partial [Bacteroidales bacterium]|nr:ArsA-related P-loop ATPase [Bacteroidales bacterium]